MKNFFLIVLIILSVWSIYFGYNQNQKYIELQTNTWNVEKISELEQQLSWLIEQFSWLQAENESLKQTLSGQLTILQQENDTLKADVEKYKWMIVQDKMNSKVWTTTNTIKSNLSTFSDNNIWFSFQYPDNWQVTINNSSNPKRIQNYSSSNIPLASWKFYIEIFYRDTSTSCSDEMWSVTSNNTINWINIERWYGVWWWDSWWTRYALCFQKSGKTIYIWYTENWNLYANQIFDSLTIN